jgi:hypothetical protein
MLKAYIMIVGLIALVPHKDAATGKVTSLTALVLATPSGATYSWNTQYPPHHAQRSFYFQPGSTLSLTGQNIQITAPASTSPGEIKIPANLPIVELTKVFLDAGYKPNEVPKIRKNCLQIDSANPCIDSKGKNLLAGIVTISGDWSVQTVEINYEHEPDLDVIDKSEYSFLAADYLPGSLVHSTTRIGGAILLEANLTKETDLIYKEGTTTYTLPSGPCLFSSSALNCVAIAVSNHPAQSVPCEQITDFDRVDFHFDRVFELLDYSSSPANLPKRFLPFVFSRDSDAMKKLCPGGFSGDPPKIKCPTASISE